MFTAPEHIAITERAVSQLLQVVLERAVLLRVRALVIVHDPIGGVVQGGTSSSYHSDQATHDV